MKFNFICDCNELDKAILYLSEKMKFSLGDDGTKVRVFKRKENGLNVRGESGEYVIEYGLIPEFCRALCILADRLNKGYEIFSFEEKRKISRCGIMADVSRNAVMKCESVKDLISRIARMGMNTFMLYMEDVYKIDNCPYFGYMRGAYTREELKEIDSYAAGFGVEVVPCIQTLAHLTSTLRWPYAEGMRDTEDVLLVGAEKTYDFIEKMISTVSECFSSKRIHIGMDEAWGLGTGVYKHLHERVDKFEMISYHLKRVVEITEKYGKEPIMWSDMLFRIGSKSGGYYDPETVVPDSVLKLIPNDVTMVYWDYYNENAEFYGDMLKAHKAMNMNIAFYGGVWTWNGVGMNYDKTFRTTAPAIKACYDNGIDEICATLWRDDGAETDVYGALLGMQLYSEYAYHEDVTAEQLAEMFRICTGYEANDFLLLDFDNLPEAVEYKKTLTDVQGVVTAAKHTLYQDILLGVFDKQYENVDLKGHYKEIYNGLLNRKKYNDLNEIFDYYTQLAKVLYLKSDLGIRITKNYKNNDKSGLEQNICELNRLLDEVCILHEKLSVLWLNENKPFGLDRLDLRFGGLKERIRRAVSRLETYTSGKTDKIEELEEERLRFADADFPAYRRYKSFISPSIG